MFTNTPKILLKEEDNKQYWFYALREDQVITLRRDINSTPKTMYGINQLIDKYHIDPRHIYMFGDVKIDENTAKNLLSNKFVEDKLNKVKSHDYKCFCCGDLILDVIIVHKTAKSAWMCMLTKLADPKFGAIIVKPI